MIVRIRFNFDEDEMRAIAKRYGTKKATHRDAADFVRATIRGVMEDMLSEMWNDEDERENES